MSESIKGQEISKWKYEVVALPKIWTKKLGKFCPKIYIFILKFFDEEEYFLFTEFANINEKLEQGNVKNNSNQHITIRGLHIYAIANIIYQNRQKMNWLAEEILYWKTKTFFFQIA